MLRLTPRVAVRCLLSGLIALAACSGLPAADPVFNWVKATDAPWQPRDSSGEVVFNDQLWLMGGWYDSLKPYYRDVWQSADGKDWSRVIEQAPWTSADLPMTVTFDNRIWFMGGWYNGRLPGAKATNEIWSSRDGAAWDRIEPTTCWSPRFAAGTAVFKNRMWVLGGLVENFNGTEADRRNDVWSSADGKIWTRELEHAPWSPRGYAGTVVFDNKLWVIGGGNYLPEFNALNDVWCTEDGKNWTQVTAAGPWHPRIWFSTVVYRDHMWMLGGWSKVPDQNWGDVWYSRDGKDWKELKSDIIWKARHEHSTYVHADRIWVAAGHARPLSNEVWSLELPRDWTGK
jgi:hypothetical protein